MKVCLQKLVGEVAKEGTRKRGRWDQTVSESFVPAKAAVVAATPSSAQRQLGRTKLHLIIVGMKHLPLRTPGRKFMATPTSIAGTPAGFFIQVEDKSANFMDNQPKGQKLPFMKPEDAQYFDKLLVDVDEDTPSADDLKE